MPLEGYDDVLKAITEIEYGSAYGIWLLKILYCNGYVSKPFRRADCWTVAYHDYTEIKKRYGKGDEDYKVKLEDKTNYYIEINEIRKKIKRLLSRKDKDKPEQIQLLNELRSQVPTPEVHGICTLFDISNIKSISASLDEETKIRVARDIKEKWTKEYSQIKAVGLLHDFIKEINILASVGSAHPIVANAKDGLSETQWCIILAVHLLRPLSDSQIYVDSHCANKKKGKCPCGCNDGVTFGDTSIGNQKVWHGSPDIIMGPIGVTFAKQPKGEANKDLYQKMVELKKVEEEEEEEAEEEEAKNAEDDGDEDTTKLSNKDTKKVSLETRSQCLSHVITFGCCKREMSPSLVPHILVNGTSIQLFMYDWNYDILLESTILPVIDKKNDSLDINTILILWLGLHWTLFSTGPTTDLYDANFPSEFKSIVKENGVFDIYLNNMLITQTSKASYLDHNKLDTPITVKRKDESDVQPLLKRQSSGSSDDGHDYKRQKQGHKFMLSGLNQNFCG